MKNKANFLSGLIALFLLLGLIAPQSVEARDIVINADPTPTTLSMSPATGMASSCCTSVVEVMVGEATQDLTAYHLEITYDRTKVQIVSVENGGHLAAPGMDELFEPTNTFDDGTGTGRILWGMAQKGVNGDPTPVDGAGSLIKITFQPLVNTGTVTFAIDPVNSLLVDWPDARSIPFTVTGGAEFILDGVAPVMEEVLPAEGALLFGPDDTFILTVDALDSNLYELEIDHSLEATLPEFSVYADADNPWGTPADQAAFEAAGVTVSYDDVEQVWTIDLGATITDALVANGGITFYMVLYDEVGNQWGTMYGPTPDNTYIYTITLDDVAPVMEEVLPAEGALLFGPDDTFILTVDAMDLNLYELEIDHSLEATLPEFSVYADADNPWGTPADQAAFEAAGVTVSYDDVEQVWTIDLGATITDALVANGGITFYMVLYDEVGNQWGTMYGPTPDNTYIYTITLDDVAPDVTVIGATADGDPMGGDLATGYILITENVPTVDHLLQISATVDEPLANEYFGLYFVAGESTVTADQLKAYYDARGVPSEPLDFLGYLKGAADGTNPFVFIKENALSLSLVDAAKHVLMGADVDMTIPDDFPVGTYVVRGNVADVAGNETTVTLKLIVVRSLAITDADLKAGMVSGGPYTALPGTYADGFVMELDPTVPWYYLDTDTITTNNPLANGLYPFYMSPDTTNPIFYVKVEGTTYTLIDAYLLAHGGGEQPLRINGDFVPGTYTYTGSLTDIYGSSASASITITFVNALAITDADLFYGTDPLVINQALGGDFETGFTMALDPLEDWYYLDTNTITTNNLLADGLYPFYMSPDTTNPIFYVKVEGTTYTLIDAYQGDPNPLRINGDFVPGTYTYTGSLTDIYGSTESASIKITFNDIPYATDQSVTVVEDTPTAITLNGVDLFPGTMTYTVVTQPAHGTLSGTAPDLTYTPDADFHGTDSFTFTLSDGTLTSAAATVSITVTSVLDAPTVDSTNLPGPYMVGLEQAFQVTLTNPTNGDAFTNVLARFRLEGVTLADIASFKYLESTDGLWHDLPITQDGADVVGNFGPATGFPMGVPYSATSQFKITFNTAGTYPASIVLYDVAADPDVVLDSYEADVVVVADFEVTDAVLTSSIDQTTWDTVQGSLTSGFEMPLLPTQDYYYFDVSTLTATRPLADGTYPFYLTETPGAGFFAYWAAKGVVEGATGWQGEMWDIINGDAPMFYLAVTGTDYSLIDGLQGAPNLLRIDGNYYPGEYAFSGIVEDAYGFTDDVPVDITFNDIPVANTQTVTTNEDTALDITLVAVDLYPGTLSWTVNTQPANGTLSGTAPDLTYTPNANWFGTDSFTFSVNDGMLTGNVATVTINVNPVNDAPVAVEDAYTTSFGTALTVAAPGVLANDTDVDQDLLMAVLVSDVTNGTLALESNGSFVYMPNSAFVGVDTFTYKANDGSLDSNIVTVSITVTSYVNTPPVAVADAYETDQNVELIVGVAEGVLANDYDVDGDNLTATLKTNVSHGVLVLKGDGSFTYAPKADFCGTDSFVYTLVSYPKTTVDGWTAEATAEITVYCDPIISSEDLDGPFYVGTLQEFHVRLQNPAPAHTYGSLAASIFVNDITLADFSVVQVKHPITSAWIPLVPVVDGTGLRLDVGPVSSVPIVPGLDMTLTFRVNFNTGGEYPVTGTLYDGAIDPLKAIATYNDTMVVIDQISPIVTISGATADGDAMAGTLEDGYILPTTNNSALDHLLQIDATVNEPLEDEYFGLKLISSTVSAADLKAYYAAKPVPEPYLSYLNSAADGVNPFVYIKANGLVLSLVDAAKHDLGGVDVAMTVPDTFPLGTYTVRGVVRDLAGNETTVTLILIVTGDRVGPTITSITAIGAEGFADVAAVGTTITVDQGYTVAYTEVVVNEPVIVAPGTVVTLAGQPYGTVAVDPTGLILTITPYPGNEIASLVGSFVFSAPAGSITDPAGNAMETMSLTLVVNNVAPVAVADDYTVAEDGVLTIAARGVLINDTDYDPTILTAVKVTDPANGTLVLNADGSFTYTPAANFYGTDTFTYKANDGLADSAVAAVTITVTSVNDAPVAQNQSVTTPEDTALLVTLVATDVDGDILTYAIVDQPAHGSVTLVDGVATYTPALDFNGMDTFTFKANDGSADSNVATVTITVTPVNDDPKAIDDAYTTDEDTTLVVPAPGVLANDSDADQDNLASYVLTQPSHGTLQLARDGSFTYVPEPNWHGVDSFTYQLVATPAPNASWTDEATVTITVNSVNDNPIAVDDFYTIDEDTQLTMSAPGVMENDSDVDLDVMEVALVTNVQHGSLSLFANGSFTYIPNPDFYGTDTFVYRLITYPAPESLWTDEATVTITVNPVGDAPVLGMIKDATIPELVDFSFTATATDVDLPAQTLTFSLVGAPEGAAITADGVFTWTPSEEQGPGVYTFTVKVCDDTAPTPLCDQQDVTLTVTEVNTAPVAQNQTITTDEEMPVDVTLVATDAENDTLTYAIVAQPAHGTVTLFGATATYTPDLDYAGPDSFTFKANDGLVDSNVAIVSIIVNPVNDAPVAVDDEYTMAEKETLTIVAPGVLANDSDVDGDTLSAILVDTVSNGTLTLNVDGSFTYTPNEYFNGTDSFTYKAKDAMLESELAVVTIAITPVNDWPIANDDSYEVVTGNELVKDAAQGILANDVLLDPDEEVSIQILDEPQHGTLSMNDDGSFTYIPNPGFMGTDTFRYLLLSVRVSSEWSDDANVTIVVKPYMGLFLPIIWR